jgi:hypothetical protein
MPEPTAPDQPPEPTEAGSAEFTYAPPDELSDEPDGGGAGRAPSSTPLKLAAVAAVALAIGGALLFYRAHHRRKVVSAALSQADALLRLDTAAGYRKASSLLEPIAQLDPIQGGSVRAFALAMLFADYRAGDAEADAEALLVAPGRAESVPAHAQLATAALALGRREAGTATTALVRAGDGPWALALQARVALLAGNVEAALEPAAASAAEGSFPAGLAVHGDVLRRLRRDPAGARAAYEAALVASPGQPRAAYGLAKLALAGDVPLAEAEAALRRILDDRDGTPAPERGRAAVHAAALRLRAGDRPGADAALDAAGLAGPARAWAARAAAAEADHRGAYRAVAGAPAELRSASDDDPGELSPEPPPAPRVVEKKAPAKKAFAGAKRSAAKKAVAKKPPPKKAAPKKATAAKKPPAKRAAAKKATTAGRQ